MVGRSVMSAAPEAAMIRVRNSVTTAVSGLLAGAMLAGLIAGQSAAGYVLVGSVFVVFAVATIRSCQCSIVLDNVGLVSRNEYSVVRRRWQEVASFEYRPMQGIGALRRRDGRFVRLQSYPGWRRTDSAVLVAGLEGEREARTSTRD